MELRNNVPKSLKECYAADPLTRKLEAWSENLKKVGYILFILIIIKGLIDTVNAAIDANELIELIGEETLEEYMERTGQHIPSVFEVVIDKLIEWGFFAFIELCSFLATSLLINALASIVHSNKVTANVSIYRASISEENTYTEGTNTQKSTFSSGAQTNMKSSINNNNTSNVWICQNCGQKNATTRTTCLKCGNEKL